MTPDRVKQILVEGITDVNRRWIGPTALQKAVLEGCKTAIQIYPDICERIAPYVQDPYQSVSIGSTLAAELPTYRYHGPLTLETKVQLRPDEDIVTVLKKYREQAADTGADPSQGRLWICVLPGLRASVDLSDAVITHPENLTNGQLVISHSDPVTIEVTAESPSQCAQVLSDHLFTLQPNVWCTPLRQFVHPDGSVQTDVLILSITAEQAAQVENWS